MGPMIVHNIYAQHYKASVYMQNWSSKQTIIVKYLDNKVKQ